MHQSSSTIQQLQAQLDQAHAKIAELETELQPLNPEKTLKYRIQNTLLEDINSLISLINSSENLIWFVDQNKRILLANKATITIFKKERGIAIEPGMITEDFLPEELSGYYNQIIDTALRGKILHLNHTSSHGKEYAATIQPVRKEDKIIGASVFAQDITKLHKLQEELRRYEQIIASSPHFISLVDRNYNYQMINDAYLEAFNKKREDLLKVNIQTILGKKVFEEAAKPHLIRAFRGEVVAYHTWLRLPKKGRRFFYVTYHPLHSQNLKPELVAINAQDITDLKQAENDRQRIFEVSLDMLCVLDFNGCFKEINPAWERILGWKIDELKGKPWLDIVISEDLDDSTTIGKQLLQGESVVGFENRCWCKNGTFKWLAWSSYPDVKQQQIFSAVRDITNHKKMEEKLLQLATTDPLTGASNRRHFIERATTELKRSRRYNSQMAVIMLDIDYFKEVNDNYGHIVGDEVLKQLVSCCHKELRTCDIFGRFGGEEFAIVLVETNRKATAQTCQRLIEKISKLKIRTLQGQVTVTVSLGFTMQTADDISIDSLLKRADDALYKAKNAGRNQVIPL